jgi:hypothetical protein
LENAEAIKPVINLALEISKQNDIGKTILNSRFKILRNIFPAENVLNNIVRINCDCNVIEILEKLNIRSVIEKTICSNGNCLKKNQRIYITIATSPVS